MRVKLLQIKEARGDQFNCAGLVVKAMNAEAHADRARQELALARNILDSQRAAIATDTGNRTEQRPASP